MQLDKSTFHFLKNLKYNNNRDWFVEHKTSFKEAQDKINEFCTYVRTDIEKYDEIDTSKLFRIYRDIRFSKDKTPYKTYFGNSFSRKGEHLRGGYHLQICPGGSFLVFGNRVKMI